MDENNPVSAKPPSPSWHLDDEKGSVSLDVIEPSTAELRDTLHTYLHAATSDNTRTAYRSAIRQFEKWGGRLPTDSQVLVRYLMHRGQSVNPRTLELHLTAIGQWHIYQGATNPTADPVVRKTMQGIRRLHGRPKQKAKALRPEHVATMAKHLRALPDSNKSRRDLALVLMGFFGAFRRSELVAIRAEDLEWEEEGVIVRMPRSKTDQHGEGMRRALPFGPPPVCPASALRMWLEKSGVSEGPIFRSVNRWDQVRPTQLSAGSVNTLLKKLGNDCGFEFAASLSSHSFRRGMSTSAAREKVEFELIKKQGGWKSDATVWEYIEEGQQLTDNAATALMKKMAKLF